MNTIITIAAAIIALLMAIGIAWSCYELGSQGYLKLKNLLKLLKGMDNR